MRRKTEIMTANYCDKCDEVLNAVVGAEELCANGCFLRRHNQKGCE